MNMRRVKYTETGRPYIIGNTGRGKGRLYGVIVKCAKCHEFTWVPKARLGRNLCIKHASRKSRPRYVKRYSKLAESLDYQTYLRNLAQTKDGPK